MTSALDFETKSAVDTSRPFVTINGEQYTLLTRADLGIRDIAKLNRLGLRLQRLSEEMTDEDADALQDDLRWSPGVLLKDCPGGVHAQLNDEQRIELVGAFGEAAGAKQDASVKKTTKRKS